MRIGVPKEIKVHEYRVGLVPAGVRELVGSGHEVLVETGAGNGIGYHAAVAGVLARAGGAGVLEILTGEPVGVVAHAEALAAGQIEVDLAQIDVIVQTVGIGSRERLQLLEGLLR